MEETLWLFLITFAITVSKTTNSNLGFQTDLRNVTNADPIKDSMEARLFEDFKLVDTMRYVRPISQNNTVGTVIKISLSLLKINEMVDRDEMLTTTVQLKVQWVDHRLRWNTTKYNDLNAIRLPANMLWLPEIELLNGYRGTQIDISKRKARVFSNGTVSISHVMHLDTSCTLDVMFYPYDDQTCNITIGSWNWNLNELVFVNGGMSIDDFEWSMTWALIGTWNKSHIVQKQNGEGFSYVVFTLYLERQSLFHSIHLIWPTIVIAVLVCLVFLLPGDSTETIGFAVTLLLTFTVYLLYAADKMPENSRSVPLLGIILMCFHMFSALSIVVCVVLLIWHFLGDHTRMPGCIRAIVFDCIRPLVCMALPKSSSVKNNSENRPMVKNQFVLEQRMRSKLTDLNRNESSTDKNSPSMIDATVENDAVGTYKYGSKICGRFFSLLYFVLMIGGFALATVVTKNLPSPCWKTTECAFVPDNTVSHWQGIRKQLFNA